MKPLQEIRKNYQDALYKVAKYKSPDEERIESIFNAETYAAKSAISEKEWSELKDDDFKALAADDAFSRATGVHVLYYAEDVWDFQAKTIKEEAEAVEALNKLICVVHNVWNPLNRVLGLVVQRITLEKCENEDITEGLTREEVFDELSSLNVHTARRLIRTIAPEFSSITDLLLESFFKNDKKAFCEELNNKSCNTLMVAKYAQLESKRLMDSNSILTANINEIGVYDDEMWLEFCRGIEEFFLKLAGHISTRADFKRLIVDLVRLYQGFIRQLPTLLDKVIVFLEENANREEQCVLESLLHNRPEVVDLYIERKAVYEKKKSEVQIDEQSQANGRLLLTDDKPLKTPDIEEIKGFVLPKDLMQRRPVGLYDDTFARYKLNREKLLAILDYLVDNSYIADQDRGILTFRLTGREGTMPEKLHQIQWTCQKKPYSPKELYYLLLCVDDDKKYSKVQEFFTGVIWPDSKRQKDMAREADANFKRKLHEIDGEVFKLYGTKK